jgi:hypothetical protein
MMHLVSYSGVSAGFLNSSEREYGEHKDYKHMQPPFVVRSIVIIKCCLSNLLGQPKPLLLVLFSFQGLLIVSLICARVNVSLIDKVEVQGNSDKDGHSRQVQTQFQEPPLE